MLGVFFSNFPAPQIDCCFSRASESVSEGCEEFSELLLDVVSGYVVMGSLVVGCVDGDFATKALYALSCSILSR